jgi:anti-anti-sigma factor
VSEIRTEHVAAQAVVVTPRGELDLASGPALRTALEDALTQVASVVLDLSDVSFIDSSIIGVIAGTSRDVARREAGSQLVVVSPPGSHPRRVLDMVAARDFLRLYDERAEALASIGW